MDWFYGLTGFCWLSRTCRPDWTARAAVGAWIAAAATFLAVYVPARNYRHDIEKRERRDRAVAVLELNRALMHVWEIVAQVNALYLTRVQMVKAIANHGVGDGKRFKLKAALPPIPFVEGFEGVIIAMTNLEATLAAWNDTIDDHTGLDSIVDHPLTRLAEVESLLDPIRTALRNVEAAANKHEEVHVELPLRDE